jgi:DNA-binding MarR family transcriptional regulator
MCQKHIMSTQRRQADPRGDAFQSLFNEVRSLMHRLRVVAAELHRQDGITAGQRGVLLSLAELGPQTVPQLARLRPVSRQHIQSHVNPLATAGYVELVDNPAHKRSRLVRLTQKGQDLVERVRARERRLFRDLGIEVTERDLLASAETLSTVTAMFQSPRYQALIKMGISSKEDG